MVYCRYIKRHSSASPDRHIKIIRDAELLTVQTAVSSAQFGYDEDTEVEGLCLDTRDGFLLTPSMIPGAVPGESFDESLAGERLCVFPPAYVSLPWLKSRFEWKDYCCWELMPKGDYGPIKYIRNTTADNAYQRRHFRDTIFILGMNTLVQMYVPFASVTSFSEIALRALLLSENSRLISNVHWEETQRTKDGMFPSSGVYAKLVLTGPDTILPDGDATITVTPYRWGEVINNPMQLELESINGYLPKNRVHLAGPASFKVRALGLEPGDTIKVKVGFRYYLGLVDHTLTVVEP